MVHGIGTPYAGNPPVRFDEGEVVLAVTPRRGSLHKELKMAIGVSEEDQKIGSTWQHSCFVAYLDILGFKDIVKRNSFEQLKSIVDDFTIGFARAVDESRSIKTNTGRITSRIKLGGGVKVRIVSDSIYVWTENDDRLKQFDDLLHVVNAMIAGGFEHGLPLRGVVTYGELFSGEVKMPDDIPFDFSFIHSSAVYGRALVEAYELEGKMDWSGAILTPKAWEKVVGEFERYKGAGRTMRSCSVKCAEDLFNHYPYFVWYDVPFKGGKRKAIAVNWNYRSGHVFSAGKIHQAFTGGRCEGLDDIVKTKSNETVRFYEYTQQAAELCESGSVKKLPVPDLTYKSTDLQNN